MSAEEKYLIWKQLELDFHYGEFFSTNSEIGFTQKKTANHPQRSVLGLSPCPAFEPTPSLL